MTNKHISKKYSNKKNDNYNYNNQIKKYTKTNG